MPPHPTQNSNREDNLIKEVESDSQTTSTGLLGTLVGPVPLEVTPSTPYDALPNLMKAFSQLANSLNNTRKPSVQAQVRELDQFNGSDTHKLQPFLTQCLLCYYCFKIIMIFYYRKIHYNAHPDTPMPNICCFLDAIISIHIESITSIFLGIFPILFLSQFYIRPPFPSSIFAPVIHGPLAPAYL